MKKELKLSDIKLSDIKDSPVFISIIILMFILAILALSVYFILDIFKIKDNIVAVREEYNKNCEQIVYLQQVRSQYDILAVEKSMLDEKLPPTEDIYVVMQNYYTLCGEYNLDVETMEIPQISATYTTETKISLTVNGTYNNIIAFIDHISDLKAIHRIEQVVIEDGEGGSLKKAGIVIVALSA